MNILKLAVKFYFQKAYCVSLICLMLALTGARSWALPANAVDFINPFIVQAENFTAMSGVKTEYTRDFGGGRDTGWIDAGDWMAYENAVAVIASTGFYQVTYRVASYAGGGSLVLKETSSDTPLDTASIPKTRGWQTWTDVTHVIKLTQGNHAFSLVAANGGFNINWFKIEPVPTPMPLTIQAENFSSMFGIGTEPTTDEGGGKNLSKIRAGDWTEYANDIIYVPKTADFKVTYRIASLRTGGSLSLVDIDSGTVLDTTSIPLTLGWQNWVDVERIISLSAGAHSLRMNMLGSGFNVNWIKIDSLIPTSSSSAASSVPSQPASSLCSSAASVSSRASSAVSSAVSSLASSKPLSSSIASVASSSASSIVPIPKQSSSASSVNSDYAYMAGPITLNWGAPTSRENGVSLNVSDLGGYQIRYKSSTDTRYSYVTINDPTQTSYYFVYLTGYYTFEIAAFDRLGTYSSFVTVSSGN